jgi:hypothetical protein
LESGSEVDNVPASSSIKMAFAMNCLEMDAM